MQPLQRFTESLNILGYILETESIYPEVMVQLNKFSHSKTILINEACGALLDPSLYYFRKITMTKSNSNCLVGSFPCTHGLPSNINLKISIPSNKI